MHSALFLNASNLSLSLQPTAGLLARLTGIFHRLNWNSFPSDTLPPARRPHHPPPAPFYATHYCSETEVPACPFPLKSPWGLCTTLDYQSSWRRGSKAGPLTYTVSWALTTCLSPTLSSSADRWPQFLLISFNTLLTSGLSLTLLPCASPPRPL